FILHSSFFIALAAPARAARSPQIDGTPFVNVEYEPGRHISVIGNISGEYVKGETPSNRGGVIMNTGTMGNIKVTGEILSNWAGITSAMDTPDSVSAYGGAIYNTGMIGSVNISSSGGFKLNVATSDSGKAYGGAIYNAGTIGAISASFIQNSAHAGPTGEAYGGAIYTTRNLRFLAADNDLLFSGNTTVDSRGTIGNAIYVGDDQGIDGVKLTFEALENRKIIMNDQIDGAIGYELEIIGAGEVSLNNPVFMAETVRVTASTLTLGTSGGENGLFWSKWEKLYDPSDLSVTNLIIERGGAVELKYSSQQTVWLASLTMRGGSTLTLGTGHTNGVSLNYDSDAGKIGEFTFVGKNTIKTNDTHNGTMNFGQSPLNFSITSSVERNDTLLTIDGSANISGTERINIRIPGTTRLFSGDKINLIALTGPTGSSGNVIICTQCDALTKMFPANKVTATQGASIIFDYDLKLSDNNRELVATLKNGRLNPQMKSLSEGNIASVAFVNQGANLAAGAGIINAVRSAIGGRNQPNNAASFSAATAGVSRYETGSHVNVTGLSLLTGLAARLSRRATVGAFIEYGIGKYGAYNDTDMGKVDADGDANYYGLGLIGHYRFGRGMYAEGTLRAGSVKNGYKSEDFIGVPEGVEYDSSTMYFGGHVGVGYIERLRRVYSILDSSIKYFATMQSGHDAKLSSGETIQFDDIWTHRLRAGTRLVLGTSVHRPYTVPSDGIVLNKFTISDAVVRPFIGAAAEYEFGTTADAKIYKIGVQAPEINGPSGLGEAGLIIENEMLSLSLAGEGYIGARQGFGATLQFRYRFEI
ncbi:MAG: autotransporter domain-containing protein, partial [Rickettsiales bacterium]|nr:autotransporter domain-containing protein [Rickettsiales bacterium]